MNSGAISTIVMMISLHLITFKSVTSLFYWLSAVHRFITHQLALVGKIVSELYWFWQLPPYQEVCLSFCQWPHMLEQEQSTLKLLYATELGFTSILQVMQRLLLHQAFLPYPSLICVTPSVYWHNLLFLSILSVHHMYICGQW